jgi:hypothetical protein
MTLPERLAHLPDRKRRELERVAAILFDEFDDALKPAFPKWRVV